MLSILFLHGCTPTGVVKNLHIGKHWKKIAFVVKNTLYMCPKRIVDEKYRYSTIARMLIVSYDFFYLVFKLVTLQFGLTLAALLVLLLAAAGSCLLQKAPKSFFFNFL